MLFGYTYSYFSYLITYKKTNWRKSAIFLFIMHKIEPYYNWRDYYIASEDKRSPFFGREYSEFEFSHTVYNYYIHPQWDHIGSETLYIKILYVDYFKQFAIIELIGEWNDSINNDIMLLKRDIVDHLLKEGIDKFILIGENILNFHGDDDCYYEEWYEDIKDSEGWIVAINFREHVRQEMQSVSIPYYIIFGEHLNTVNWRTLKPIHFFLAIDHVLNNGFPQLNE